MGNPSTRGLRVTRKGGINPLPHSPPKDDTTGGDAIRDQSLHARTEGLQSEALLALERAASSIANLVSGAALPERVQHDGET